MNSTGIPDEIEFNKHKYKKHGNTLQFREMQGDLNIVNLKKDGLLKLTTSPVSMSYKYLNNSIYKAIFIGQTLKGHHADGFVRIIYSNGFIYEGQCNQDCPHGWGRQY